LYNVKRWGKMKENEREPERKYNEVKDTAHFSLRMRNIVWF
jgi:hypothetical protein